MSGSAYLDLAFWGLTFVPLYCASYLLEIEEDISLNIYAGSRGGVPILTG